MRTGANYSTCSVWVWDGSAYSAFWDNHAAGRITVDSASRSRIQMKRIDTAGAAAGLSATYTAKRDGKTFSEGKLDFSFKGATGTFNWTASPAVTPVVHLPHRDFMYVNWYPAPLTAYAVFHTANPSAGIPGSYINDYRILVEQPMGPGETRQMPLRRIDRPANYIEGANYPESSAIAAIYADGSTFGDRNVLMEMVQMRRSMIAALTTIGNTVCTLGHQEISTIDLDAALDKQHSQEDASSPSRKEERDIAYAFIIKSLDNGTHSRLPAAQAIKKTYDLLNQRRSNLADPVRDSGGQLLIPSIPPLSCSLP